MEQNYGVRVVERVIPVNVGEIIELIRKGKEVGDEKVGLELAKKIIKKLDVKIKTFIG